MTIIKRGNTVAFTETDVVIAVNRAIPDGATVNLYNNNVLVGPATVVMDSQGLEYRYTGAPLASGANAFSVEIVDAPEGSARSVNYTVTRS